MSLVLFIVGLLGVISIYAKQLTEFYESNFEIFVYLSDTASNEEARKVEKEIKGLNFVNSTVFIDREIAARKAIRSQGNDFIKTLGFNPYPHAIQINIKSDYAEEGKIELIERQLLLMPLIDDINYAKDDLGKNLLSQIKENFKMVRLVLLGVAGILLLISIALINSTVRINMFARRFLIKSMQYVGASDWFIIKPFLGMYTLYASIAVLVSCSLLFSIVYLFESQFNLNYWQLFIPQYALLAGFLLVLAFIISWISVFFATKRYLKLKIDQLY